MLGLDSSILIKYNEDKYVVFLHCWEMSIDPLEACYFVAADLIQNYGVIGAEFSTEKEAVKYIKSNPVQGRVAYRKIGIMDVLGHVLGVNND